MVELDDQEDMYLSFLAVWQENVAGRIDPMPGILGQFLTCLQVLFPRKYFLSLFRTDRALAGIFKFDDIATLFCSPVGSNILELKFDGFPEKIH